MMIDRLFIVMLLVLATFSANAAPSSVAASLRPNVVTVAAKINDSYHKGFAIIVGENSDRYYFATANHVVRGAKPRDRTQELYVQFYQAEALKFEAELHSVSDRKNDIAFFTVRKDQNTAPLAAIQDRPPLILFRWDAIGGVDNDLLGQPVSSIGGHGKWELISGNARVANQEIPFLYVEQLNVDRGSSGSPLLDQNGMVGLLSEHDANTTKVVSLARVQALAQQYGIPWNLTERRSESDLSGHWQTQEKWEDDATFLNTAAIEIQHLDLVRFKVTAVDTGTTGYGIVNGTRVKVWWESTLWGDEFAEFVIKTDRNDQITLSGRAVDEESDEEYQIRVTRTGNSEPTLPAPRANHAVTSASLQGCWNMQAHGIMTVNGNNTAASGPYQGVVTALSANQYEILWDRFVDVLQLSPDGQQLQGKNNYAWPIQVNRVSGSPGSVIGSWNWNGPLAELRADGTVVMNTITAGRWIKKSGNIEIHWLSRLAYLIHLIPGPQPISGTLGIRFETAPPVPDLQIGILSGKPC